MKTNPQSVEAFAAALEVFAERARLEEGDGPDYYVFHLLVGLVEFCEARGVDLEKERREVRQYFAEFHHGYLAPV